MLYGLVFIILIRKMDVFQLHVLDNILGVKENYFKIRIQVLPYNCVLGQVNNKKSLKPVSKKKS